MKGFVISWFYPPINSSEGLVTYKLLNRSSIPHDVFTQKDSSIWSYNKSENELTNKNIRAILGNGKSFEEWRESCVEYYDEHRSEYDFIMSRSMPLHSHEAALLIKKKYPNTRWVASFGDPIYNSPFTKLAATLPTFYGISPRLPNLRYFISLFKHQVKKQLWYYQSRHDRRSEAERKILEYNTLTTADTVIFNNVYQRDFMLKQHNLEVSPKYIVLPHPYETSLYSKDVPKKRKDKIVITHIGHLDLIRTPIGVLSAVNRLKNKRPDLYKRLDLNFYGVLDNLSKIYVVDQNLFDAVHIHKSITYFDSLKIMQDSNWCLLIDANISTQSEKNIYFAAKLADYLGSKTPILAISMTEGASADIIRETNNIVSSHSIDEIYMTLVMILEKRINVQPTRTSIKFDAKNIAGIYDQTITSLLELK